MGQIICLNPVQRLSASKLYPNSECQSTSRIVSFILSIFPIFAGFVVVFPQGTVLAPLFFLLFINDIVDLLDSDSVCKLFADDVKLYSNFNLSNAYNSDNNPLVLTLSNLETWSRVWQMRVNISKCSVLHLGLHNPLFQYTFNDKPLPTSSSVKDLGITYNHKLQFDVYILKIVSRAFQMVNLIFRSFVSRNIQILVYFIYLLNLYSHEQNIQIMQWETNIKIIYAMFSEKGGEGPKMPLIPDLGE